MTTEHTADRVREMMDEVAKESGIRSQDYCAIIAFNRYVEKMEGASK